MEIREKGTCLLCEYLIVINNLQRTYIKTSKFAINIFYHVNISKKKKKKEKSKITTNLSLVLVQI